VSASIAAGSTLLVLRAIGGEKREPGPISVLAVVVAGFALSGLIYHAIRLRAAGRMRREPVSLNTVRAHLQSG